MSEFLKLNRLTELLKQHERTALLIMTFIALILRFVMVFNTNPDKVTVKWDDDWYYLSMGEQIAAGNWDPQADGRPHMVVGPAIPLIIALFIKFFGNSELPMFLFNALMTSLTVPVLYYLGKEIFNISTAWIIALWAVVFIEYFKYLNHLLKEPFLFLLVPLTLLFQLRSVKNSHSLYLLLLSSVSFAILIHIDERYIIYFPVFVLSFLLIRPLSAFNFLKPAAIWSVMVLLLMMPWSIKNYRTFDQVVILTPRTTAFTSKIWGSNLEAATSHFAVDSIRDGMNEARMIKAEEFGKEYGIKPKEQDISEARLKALMNFWQPTYFRPTFIQYGFRPMKWSLPHNAASLIFYGVFLPFYIIGIFMLIRDRHYMGLFLASVPVLHSLIHAYMVWPLERYRSPVTFIVVIIGIWAALTITDSLQKRLWHSKEETVEK